MVVYFIKYVKNTMKSFNKKMVLENRKIKNHLAALPVPLNRKDHISMISQKVFKSYGIIYRIRNTLGINYKRLICYSIIHPYLTCCVNICSFKYQTNFTILCTAQKRSVRALFATAQQPHSRDIFSNKKILSLDKLINQQEGILAYKVISGTYLLGDSLTERHDVSYVRQ